MRQLPTAQRVPWLLAVTGFALLLILLTVLLVQARQFSLLRQAVQLAPEHGVAAVYQAEFEYQRLVQQWQTAVDDRVTLDERALQQRYDSWVSRVAELRAGHGAQWATAQEKDLATLEQAQRFAARVAPVLGSTPDPALAAGRAPVTREFLAAELPQLRALAEPIHAMTLNAADQAALMAEQRNQAVQRLNLLGLGLTALVSLLTLAFAVAALRLLKQGLQRRQALENLTERLSRAQHTAESASAAKSEFLAHMSHELRTPFHGLMGMLSLLRETGLGTQQQAYLRTATESADHLLAVLNDILDLSQLENGRLRLALVAVDLRTLLREVEALVRPQAMAKSLSFHVDVGPDVPERCMLDPMRVRQILFNLLSNAISCTHKGTVALDVRVRQGEPNAPVVEFCITDTRAGLDTDALAALFSRSSIAYGSKSGQARGAVLGLEISRKLARLMDGDLVARSQPDQGSCFTLKLPMREAPHVQAAPAAEGLNRAPTRSLHVLVAEDHPVNRDYIEQLLQGMGLRASLVSDGEAAVAAAREQAFDMVLMDLHLPLLDGLAATRAIRSLPDTARSTVPIVALTADAFEETRDRCMVAGMNGFLSKPLKPEMLATTLRRLFGPLVPASGAGWDRRWADTALARDKVAGAAPLAPKGFELPCADSNDADAAAGSAASEAVSSSGEGELVDAAAVRLLLQSLPREQYASLAQRYFEQAPHTARRMRAAVRDGQPLDLQANAHATMGAALSLGFAALAATAESLQQGAAHLPAHEIARQVQRFEDQTKATHKELLAQGLLSGAPLVAS